MKAKKTFKPQNLRSLLVTMLVLIVIAGAGLFYLGLNFVREYAVEVNHRLLDAQASGQQIENLQSLKAQLSESNSLVEKANALFSTPANYQTQALTDIKNYADAAGVSIASTTFADAASGAYAVTITLKQPVAYSKLVHFLDAVESNLPKMQVTSIVLGHVDGGGADSVKVGEIKIDISVRN